MIDWTGFVDLRDVQNGLRRMQLAGKDLRPVWRRTRKELRRDQREHAKAQAGPDEAWAPLAASTIEHRKAKARTTGKATARRRFKRKRLPSPNRKLLGRLPGAFKITYDARRILGVNRVAWSGAQFYGGRVGRRARLPGRKFYWVSQSLLILVARFSVDYMVGAWDKGV